MRSNPWLRAFAVAASLTFVVAACGGDDDDDAAESTTTTSEGEPAGEPDAPLVIGTLLPQSGSLSAIIGALATPIDMAVEEINAAGGVMGEDVTIAAADDATDDSTIAAASFDRLVNSDNIDVLLGPAGSPLAEALMSDIKSNDIVACSGSNTAAGLEELDDGGHYFGFAPNDNLQGPALAEVIGGDGYERVAILARNDSYGTGFAGAIEENLASAGVEVVLNEAYDPNGASFENEAQQVADSNAQAVAVIGYSDDGAKVVSALIEAGKGPKDFPVYTGDGMKGSSFAKTVDASDLSLVEGLGGTAPAASPAGVEHPFQAKYAETGEDTIFSAYFYDCAIATALAAEAAQSDAASEVSAALLEVTSGGTKCNTFQACKDLLADGEDIDYDGASGTLDLNENGHVTSGSYDIWAYDAAGVDTTSDDPQIVIEL